MSLTSRLIKAHREAADSRLLPLLTGMGHAGVGYLLPGERRDRFSSAVAQGAGATLGSSAGLEAGIALRHGALSNRPVAATLLTALLAGGGGVGGALLGRQFRFSPPDEDKDHENEARLGDYLLDVPGEIV